MKRIIQPLTIKYIKNKIYKIQNLSIAQTEYLSSLIELAYNVGKHEAESDSEEKEKS